MISHLQSSANSAVELMEKECCWSGWRCADLVTNAGSELDGIVSQVNQINDMNFQIATAAGQQSSVAEEMSVNLTNVRELVRSVCRGGWWASWDFSAYESNAQELDGKIKQFRFNPWHLVFIRKAYSQVLFSRYKLNQIKLIDKTPTLLMWAFLLALFGITDL